MAQGIVRPGMIKEASRPIAEEAILKGDAGQNTQPAADLQQRKIGRDQILKATEILKKYKEGKATLEAKITENEQFWKLRQWGNVSNDNKTEYMKSTTWLWSCIQGRYSDAMDSFPTCNIKPRQSDDKAQAKMLSSIVPVVLEQNKYEETYSDIAWYTLKQGGSIQGIFWDITKHNGLGDIAVKKIDILNAFWQPGITDLQQSRHFFTIELVDNEVLEQRFPETVGHLNGNTVNVATYIYDDKIDTKEKSVVVDWYYHTEYGGKKVLQFCKFVNDVVLFASENETTPPTIIDPVTGLQVPHGESMAQRGYYDHGLYPFVVMNLYPIEGSLIGYGLTDIGRSTQLDIDTLNNAMVENAAEGANPRYFVKANSQVNSEEFLDRKKKLVKVEGSLDEQSLRPIDTKPLDGNYINFFSIKTDELKTATSNQDVHNGSTSSGVTAASAIAALQEAAGKNARSSNREFYRAYKEVVYQVIELIRQFYDSPRVFRIAPDAAGNEEFVNFDNSGIVGQPQIINGIDMGLRLPEFDVDVTAEKASPYKKMEMNELALNFYAQGFFNPQMADQALACLEIMDFDHKDLVVSKIQQNQTLQMRLLQFEQLALELAKKSDPLLAEQIGAMILEESGGQAPTGAAVINLEDEENPAGNARVNAAREQAINNTKV